MGDKNYRKTLHKVRKLLLIETSTKFCKKCGERYENYRANLAYFKEKQFVGYRDFVVLRCPSCNIVAINSDLLKIITDILRPYKLSCYTNDEKRVNEMELNQNKFNNNMNKNASVNKVSQDKYGRKDSSRQLSSNTYKVEFSKLALWPNEHIGYLLIQAISIGEAREKAIKQLMQTSRDIGNINSISIGDITKVDK